MAGFIKIYRDVLDSVLFTKPILLQMWLLLNKLARFTETEQDGIEIHPGQVLTSNPALAQRCNLTERRVRYILDCLEDMQLITRENIRNRYTMITLTNPDEIKCVTQTELPPPREEQEEKAPAPPPKEQKICCGMFGNVYLTIEEKKQLSQRWDDAEQYIDRLSAYKRRTGKTYSDDFAVLCEWLLKDESSSPGKQQEAPVSKPATPASPATPVAPKPKRAHFPGTDTDFNTAPASYDLERAEYIARTSVPVLRKRNGVKTEYPK
ncbi:MAG: hypothetical protein IKB13_05395 [Clostridia bacterium]|nr:hypothetical protein [Clostridia bacterium]